MLWYIYNIYNVDCCKTILVKLEGRDHVFTFKLYGVKNESPMWKTGEDGYELYYENDKWTLGGGPYFLNEKYFISDSSDECPESVESWSNQIDGLKLEGGKIECDSTLWKLVFLLCTIALTKLKQ